MAAIAIIIMKTRLIMMVVAIAIIITHSFFLYFLSMSVVENLS